MAINDGSDDTLVDTFTTFFVEHRVAVERHVRYRLNSDVAEIDDVVNEVFMVALHRFDQVSAFTVSHARAWLRGVATNRCSHRHRSRHRLNRLYERLAERARADAIGSFEEELVATLSGSDNRTRVNDVLVGLIPSYREILRLDMSSEASGRQMAMAIDSTEVATRLRLMRARRAFAEQYESIFGAAQAGSGVHEQ
jgi:RNA polymerase sigma factor (sigma-70 family)